MNHHRRKQIVRVIERLEELADRMAMVGEDILEILSGEEDARDGFPGSLQGTERYQAAEAAIESLNSAYDDLQSYDIEAVISTLREAAK